MENEFNRFVDALPRLVWTALPDRHIDFLNQRWCEYTGLSVSPRTPGCDRWCDRRPQPWRHSAAAVTDGEHVI
jgi:PAS domain-containing protein